MNHYTYDIPAFFLHTWPGLNGIVLCRHSDRDSDIAQHIPPKRFLKILNLDGVSVIGMVQKAR